MKTQEQRDRETVVIARAMVGFAVVAFVAGLASAPLSYLYRHRRP